MAGERMKFSRPGGPVADGHGPSGMPPLPTSSLRGVGSNDSSPAHPPTATGRNQATPATGAERAGSRVGYDDFRARSLLSANEAMGGTMAGERPAHL